MRRRKLKVLSVVLGVSCALLLAEVGLRLAGIAYPPLYHPDPHRGWAPAAGAHGLHRGEGAGPVPVALDPVGLRSDPGRRGWRTPREKAPGEFRVALLGDSMAEGFQVPREATVGERLERALEACPHRPPRFGSPCGPGSPGGAGSADCPVTVLGFGVSGYGTAQQLLTLREAALDYHPDLVLLLFYAGNDVADNHPALTDQHRRPFLRATADGSWRWGHSFRERHGYRLREGPWAAPVYLALRHSRVLQLLAAAWSRRGAPPAPARAAPRPADDDRVYLPDPPPPWPEAWAATEELLHRTAGTARRAGADFLLVSASTGIQAHPDHELRRRFAAALGVDDLWGPERRLAAIAQRGGFPFLPLAPALAERAEVAGQPLHGAGGFGHWNEAGHRAAAELVADALCRRWAEAAPTAASPPEDAGAVVAGSSGGALASRRLPVGK